MNASPSTALPEDFATRPRAERIALLLDLPPTTPLDKEPLR